MKSSLNKFVKGLVQDVNDINQGSDSYSDSMGGSLMYNNNGNFDWVVSNGNKLSLKIAPNGGADTDKYIPIGAVGNTDIKIMFIVHEATPGDRRSEIGVFSADESLRVAVRASSQKRLPTPSSAPTEIREVPKRRRCPNSFRGSPYLITISRNRTPNSPGNCTSSCPSVTLDGACCDRCPVSFRR